MHRYRELLDIQRPGVVHIPAVLGSATLHGILDELADPERVAWHDAHGTHRNRRGIDVTQNLDMFALKLSRGDQEPLRKLPHIDYAVRAIFGKIRELSFSMPHLADWQPDEVSIHRYDHKDIGISTHKDNARFWGVIAILGVDGTCDLAVKHADRTFYYASRPGDLMLLRAPGLINPAELPASVDPRPEHAVVNLRTPTRTSLMLRANDRPDEIIPGFHFANWSGE